MTYRYNRLKPSHWLLGSLINVSNSNMAETKNPIWRTHKCQSGTNTSRINISICHVTSFHWTFSWGAGTSPCACDSRRCRARCTAPRWRQRRWISRWRWWWCPLSVESRRLRSCAPHAPRLVSSNNSIYGTN